MSLFAIKILAVLALVCVLVQDTTANDRKYVYGEPQENEIVFVATRQLIAHPFIKRRGEIAYPEEFYLDSYQPSDIIHGIEVYELPDESACDLQLQIFGGIGLPAGVIRMKADRGCGLYVTVTFRVHRPKKENRTDQADTDTQVEEETPNITEQTITEKQVDGETKNVPDQATEVNGNQ